MAKQEDRTSSDSDPWEYGGNDGRWAHEMELDQTGDGCEKPLQKQMNSLKIALVGPVHPYRGGIAHYTTLLASHLSKRHQMRIISFRRQYPSWLFPGRSDRDPSRAPLKVSNVSYTLDPLWPPSWISTAKDAGTFAPDLLLIQWWTTFWAPCLITFLRRFRRLCPAATVVTICHNVMPHERHVWDRRIAKWALSLVDRYLVHSREDECKLLELIPEAEVEVVSFPSYAGIVENKPTQDAAREILGLDKDLPVALFFGFVRPYKGLRYLLQAIDRVRRERPVHLLVVGEFWDDKQTYLKQIQKSDLSSHVTIIDRYVPNEEIGAYFAAADVLVLPYVETSQSAVLRLSLDLHLPVIATRVGGLSESVIEDVNGLLAEPKDVNSLSDALLRYFDEDLESSMRSNIRHKDSAGWREIVQYIESLD